MAMVQDPDFRAFNQYLEAPTDRPLLFIDGGRFGRNDDYIVVNLHLLPFLNDNEFESYSAQITNAITEERAAPQNLDEARNEVRRILDTARHDGGAITNSEGGLVELKIGIAYFDKNEISLESRAFNSGLSVQENFTIRSNTAFNDQQQQLFVKYVRLHEGAHMTLHLDEAGADYVAARMLLKANPGPETESLLQTIADMRAIAPYRNNGVNGPDMPRIYGIECSEAIIAAIANQRTEAGASLEDIYSNAQTYDDMNLVNGRLQVNLRAALISANPGIHNPDFRQAGFSAAVQSLMNSGAYEPQSREYAILQELKEASSRMEQMVERAEPSVSSSAPRTGVQPPSPQ